MAKFHVTFIVVGIIFALKWFYNLVGMENVEGGDHSIVATLSLIGAVICLLGIVISNKKSKEGL